MVAAVSGRRTGEDPGTEPEVLEAVKIALELGNDLNAVDKNGETLCTVPRSSTRRRWCATGRTGRGWTRWNRSDKRGWSAKIAEGVQRGMNIISSPATEAAIREVMKSGR